MNVRLGAWMMNAELPYDVNASGGWYDELPHFSCASNGTVRPGGGVKQGSAHSNDWKIADETTAWMRQVCACGACVHVCMCACVHVRMRACVHLQVCTW